MSIRSYFQRWNLSTLWLPMLVVMSLLAWLVLGVLDRTATLDTLAVVMQLPIRTMYALAALVIAWLAQRRYRRRLSDEEQKALWLGVMSGQRGPLLVYAFDTGVWLCTVLALLHFFSVSH